LKRLLLFGDMHCGNELGLTHPHWIAGRAKGELKKFWNSYKRVLKKIGKVDIAVGMGDLVDGPGPKDTTHLIETDLSEQTDMAIAAIKEIKADQMFLIRGTGYHVDNGFSVEDLVARELGVRIYDHRTIIIEGKKYNFSHKVGRSTTPYGKVSPLAKVIVKNILANLCKMEKIADYFFRAHVHYYVGATLGEREAYSNLCLQLRGPTESKFTRGLEEDQYDVGLLEVLCYNDGIRRIPHYIDNGGI